MTRIATKATLLKYLLLVSVMIFLVPKFAFAHPGRTASDGCHYCRTNCSSWGVPWGERHCHGRVKDDPVEKLMGTSGLPEEALVSIEHDHSH